MQLSDAIRRYLNQSFAQGNSCHTIRGAKSALKQLAAFLEKINVTDVAHLDHDALMRYREELAWRLTPKGTPLSVLTQLELLGHIAVFCRFLVAQGWLLVDPSANIPRPKKPRHLPRNIMEPADVERILAQPDTQSLRGFRNRVILEVLYSTALRREEIANLEMNDVDIEGGYVFVREGKGGKDRVVPLGKNACDLVTSYLLGIRPQWPNAAKDKHLFLNRWGKGMGPNSVGAVVSKYAKLSSVDKPVSTHSFRHSCATHMLRNGAPIRQLQEMLGHASLETTQLYTHVTINDLRAMHRKFHPREKG
ncbi:MAG: tyrosine-type recombinase/integrase [Sulfuricaulis sp.]